MDYKDFAAINPRLNCPLSEAHVFQKVCEAIGFNHARVFAEPQPSQLAPSLLIPETANKKDGDEPDLQTGFVDTTGNDLSAVEGDNTTPIFAMVKVDESPDFFTVAPTMKRLRSGNISRTGVLQDFIHEVAEEGRIPRDRLVDEHQLAAVEALLAS